MARLFVGCNKGKKFYLQNKVDNNKGKLLAADLLILKVTTAIFAYFLLAARVGDDRSLKNMTIDYRKAIKDRDSSALVLTGVFFMTTFFFPLVFSVFNYRERRKIKRIFFRRESALSQNILSSTPPCRSRDEETKIYQYLPKLIRLSFIYCLPAFVFSLILVVAFFRYISPYILKVMSDKDNSLDEERLVMAGAGFSGDDVAITLLAIFPALVQVVFFSVLVLVPKAKRNFLMQKKEELDEFRGCSSIQETAQVEEIVKKALEQGLNKKEKFNDFLRDMKKNNAQQDMEESHVQGNSSDLQRLGNIFVGGAEIDMSGLENLSNVDDKVKFLKDILKPFNFDSEEHWQSFVKHDLTQAGLWGAYHTFVGRAMHGSENYIIGNSESSNFVLKFIVTKKGVLMMEVSGAVLDISSFACRILSFDEDVLWSQLKLTKSALKDNEEKIPDTDYFSKARLELFCKYKIKKNGQFECEDCSATPVVDPARVNISNVGPDFQVSVRFWEPEPEPEPESEPEQAQAPLPGALSRVFTMS